MHNIVLLFADREQSRCRERVGGRGGSRGIEGDRGGSKGVEGGRRNGGRPRDFSGQEHFYSPASKFEGPYLSSSSPLCPPLSRSQPPHASSIQIDWFFVARPRASDRMQYLCVCLSSRMSVSSFLGEYEASLEPLHSLALRFLQRSEPRERRLASPPHEETHRRHASTRKFTEYRSRWILQQRE